MQHTFNYPRFGSPNVHSNSPAFNVVIAYEDFETGKDAKRTSDFLVESLGRDCESNNQMWKFDVLSIPKLQAMAAKDAMAADIVIISCRGEELPAQVRDWVEAWVSEPGGPMALVALLAGGSGETSHVRAYLEHVARRKQIEFFAQPDQGTSRLGGELGLQMNRGLGDRALTTLAGAADRDITPRWGINE